MSYAQEGIKGKDLVTYTRTFIKILLWALVHNNLNEKEMIYLYSIPVTRTPLYNGIP